MPWVWWNELDRASCQRRLWIIVKRHLYPKDHLVKYCECLWVLMWCQEILVECYFLLPSPERRVSDPNFLDLQDLMGRTFSLHELHIWTRRKRDVVLLIIILKLWSKRHNRSVLSCCPYFIENRLCFSNVNSCRCCKLHYHWLKKQMKLAENIWTNMDVSYFHVIFFGYC